jgi:5-methyltetrahydrofolate--homocysteine methyltransferase
MLRGTIEYRAMIEEIYKIRPAQVIHLSDHHLNHIWKLLNVEKEIGVTLTESMAMWPASSVSGYYFGNQESIFWARENKEDQVIDYATKYLNG